MGIQADKIEGALPEVRRIRDLGVDDLEEYTDEELAAAAAHLRALAHSADTAAGRLDRVRETRAGDRQRGPT